MLINNSEGSSNSSERFSTGRVDGREVVVIVVAVKDGSILLALDPNEIER